LENFFEEQPDSANCGKEYCSHLQEKDAKILFTNEKAIVT